MPKHPYASASILTGTDKHDIFWARLPGGGGGYVQLVIGTDGIVTAVVVNAAENVAEGVAEGMENDDPAS